MKAEGNGSPPVSIKVAFCQKPGAKATIREFLSAQFEKFDLIISCACVPKVWDSVCANDDLWRCGL